MADAVMLEKVFEALVVAWVIFLSQDYLRMRFNPPWIGKEACKQSHEAANVIADKREEIINHLRDRMESRMDRLEGLLMMAITRKVKPDASDIFNGLCGMDAPRKD